MSDHRTVLVAKDAPEALRLAMEKVASIGCEAVDQRGDFTLALAGGTTPQPLYQLLAQPLAGESVPWQQTEVFFGDERDVSADHPDSNYRMAQQTLLGQVPILLENVHPMPGDATDLDLAAEQYAQCIAELVPPGAGGLPAFDLILLGMGGDGHTASLFPNSAALDEAEKLVVVQFVPVLSRQRMTFTFPLINAARHVLFLITGMDKADVIERVLSDDEAIASQLPAGRVRPTDGELIFILDAHAARRTGYKAQSAETSREQPE